METSRPRHVLSVEMQRPKTFVNKNRFAELDVTDNVVTGDLIDINEFVTVKKKQHKIEKNHKKAESRITTCWRSTRISRMGSCHLAESHPSGR